MLKHLNLIGIVDVVVVVNGVVVATLVVQLGLDFKLNTKIGLDTTHHPPPQTFRPLPGLLGG